MRGDAAFQAEAAAAVNQPVHLVSVELGCSFGKQIGSQSVCEAWGGSWTAPIYLTDYTRKLEWDGNEWLAAGGFLSVGDIAETIDMQIGTVSVALSGVDQSMLSIFLSKEFIDRPLRIWTGFITGNQLTITPVELFKGYISSVSINDSPDSTGITVSAQNHFADFEKTSGRFTNNADMEKHHSGDTSFKYASSNMKEIRWGRE